MDLHGFTQAVTLLCDSTICSTLAACLQHAYRLACDKILNLQPGFFIDHLKVLLMVCIRQAAAFT